MSTEQTVEQRMIEETRHQIRGLVSEIAQLAKSELSPLEFYTEFLNRVVSALAAAGGAVWMTGAEGGLELQYQINLVETNLVNSPEKQQRHGRLLHKVITSGEGSLSAPNSGAADDDQAGNPTDFLLVLGPLKNDQQTQGVVEVFQRPNAAPTAQRGYLRFLLQMCELASDFLKTRRLREFTDRQVLWLQLENFTRAAHASLDPRETAYTIANEGRRLIDCDRVSVAIRKGSKCVIEAVSGQDLFDKRSNTIALLNRLASAVAATGESVWYTGDTTDMPPQVEDAIQAYVDDSHSKTVAVLPLKKPIKDPEPDKVEQAETIGALIVEQIENRRLSEGMLHRVNVVCDHSSSAMTNALEHQNLFLMPVWRAIGKSKWIVEARTLPKTISIGVAVLAAIIALIVIPYDFDLKGNGTLEPVVKRDVFAPLEGRVDEARRHGTMVRASDPLGKMHNMDLETSELALIGKLQATQEQLYAVQRELAENKKLTPTEVVQLRGDELEKEATRANLEEQLKVLRAKMAQLVLTSPIDGEVITWDVENLLVNRSVQPGQLLITVADPAGDWELEVKMPEDRMGHVTRAQLQDRKDLRVRYILATDPHVEYEGRVTEVHYAAEVRGEEGNTVIIRVSLDDRQLDPLRKHMMAEFGLAEKASREEFQNLVRTNLFNGELTTEKFVELSGLRPGATAIAKIHCGRRAIGYVWFHDAVAWVHRTWFTIW